jgi:hypothetical protein
MAFPASPSNNQVHKEGNRAFVYDSALGTWDQVRETDRTENKILQGDIGVVTGTMDGLDYRSGVIGSGVTGFTGIKVCDQWRLSTSHASGTGITIFDENLERADTYQQGDGTNAIIGGSTRMHWNSSDGYFTFPQTGIWRIDARIRCYGVSDDVDYVNIMMDLDYGSGPAHMMTGIESVHKLDSYCEPSFATMIDVVDISTYKVRFKWNSQANIVVQGSSTVSHTSFTFTRLGDT